MKSTSLFFIALFTLCFIPDASAYLDPGSGSAIIQMIIAGVLGGAFAIKMGWRSIVAFFRGTTGEEELDEADESID